MMRRKRPQGYVPGRNHLVDAALRELRKGLQPGEDPFFWDMNRDWSKVHGEGSATPTDAGAVDPAEGSLRAANLPAINEDSDIRRQPTLEIDFPGKKPRARVAEQGGSSRAMRYMWAALVLLLVAAVAGWIAFLRHPAQLHETAIAHTDDSPRPSMTAIPLNSAPAVTPSVAEPTSAATPITSTSPLPQAVPPSTPASKRIRPAPSPAVTGRARVPGSEEEATRYNHGMD